MMGLFRAGLAVAALFIGGISAFLGTVVTASALANGSIQFGFGDNAQAFESVAYADGPFRFGMLLAGMGLLPLILGLIAAIWGWRSINGRA